MWIPNDVQVNPKYVYLYIYMFEGEEQGNSSLEMESLDDHLAKNYTKRVVYMLIKSYDNNGVRFCCGCAALKPKTRT